MLEKDWSVIDHGLELGRGDGEPRTVGQRRRGRDGVCLWIDKNWEMVYKCIKGINTLEMETFRKGVYVILLDYRDKRPIYEQVVEKLERLIVGGALEQEAKMPSVRSLAMDLSVNPNTIQRAYVQLEQEGYLYTVSGRGSFVAPPSEWRESKLQKTFKEWEELTTQAKETGITKAQLLEGINCIYKEADND